MSANLIHSEYLKLAGVDINATTLASGTAYYSDAIRVHYSTGFAALLVTLTSADDVDISFQVSLDGKNFYTPVDTAGASLGVIYTTLTATAWIVFSPKIAEYIRFLIDPDAESVVTAQYIQQERAGF